MEENCREKSVETQLYVSDLGSLRCIDPPPPLPLDEADTVPRYLRPVPGVPERFLDPLQVRRRD
jgi:hypothetical protein